MKVLHIGYSDYGGAGRGMMSLHKALKGAGVDSKVLVADKASFDGDITCAAQNLNFYPYSRNKLLRFVQKAIRKNGWCLNQLDKYRRMIKQIPADRSCFYTFPITHYDISRHPLVQEADIIHLHWIADFVNFPSFFPSVDKPVVWTLRDENPGLGGFHIESDLRDYGKYYASIEKDFLDIKRNALSTCRNLTVVAMSDVMESFCASNDLLKAIPARRIENPVDSSLFNSIDKSLAKKALCLDEDVYTILFVAVNLHDPIKNLQIVTEAMGKLPFPSVLVCVGNDGFFSTVPEHVICLNSVKSERLLSVAYSAADVFVTPSIQEAFGKTTVEALACGTPVISSKTGIAPEVITQENGVLLEDITVDSVVWAIESVHGNHYDRESIRAHVVDRFAPSKIVRQYMELYEELVQKAPMA